MLRLPGRARQAWEPKLVYCFLPSPLLFLPLQLLGSVVALSYLVSSSLLLLCIVFFKEKLKWSFHRADLAVSCRQWLRFVCGTKSNVFQVPRGQCVAHLSLGSVWPLPPRHIALLQPLALRGPSHHSLLFCSSGSCLQVFGSSIHSLSHPPCISFLPTHPDEILFFCLLRAQ